MSWPSCFRSENQSYQFREKEKNLTGPRHEGDEDGVRRYSSLGRHWALIVSVTQISLTDPGPLSTELASEADVLKVQQTLLIH